MIKKNESGEWVEEIIVTRDQVQARLDDITARLKKVQAELVIPLIDEFKMAEADLAAIDAMEAAPVAPSSPSPMLNVATPEPATESTAATNVADVVTTAGA